MRRLTAILMILIGMGLASLSAAEAGTVFGLWKTIDDKTGESKSWVRISEQDGKLYGTIEKLLLKPADTVCDLCKPPLKDKPVVGMQIINGLSKSGKAYSKGEILDPAKGKWYTCKVWLGEDGVLNVRGYIGFLYRTQKWYRVSDSEATGSLTNEG